MKRLMLLVIVSGLLLLVSTASFGAIHNAWGDFTTPNEWFTMNTPAKYEWYYIHKEDPYMMTNVNLGTVTNNYSMLTGGGNNYGFIYYKDDQTYAEAYRDESFMGFPMTWFKGSYKLDNGIFVAVKHATLTFEGTDIGRDISSFGYSYSLGDSGYIALSKDYYSMSQGGNGLPMIARGDAGYELAFRYYNDKMRVFGELYQSQENDSFISEGSIVAHAQNSAPLPGISQKGLFSILGIDYQLTENVVAGIEYVGQPNKYNNMIVGATWNIAPLELNFQYSHDSNKLSATQWLGMYKYSDKLSIGAAYKNANDLYFGKRISYSSLLSNYALTDSDSLRLQYQLGDKYYSPVMSIAWYKSL